MHKHHRGRTPLLLAACAILAVLVAAPVVQATTNPTVMKVPGNPKCVDYGLVQIALFQPVEDGTRGGVTIDRDGVTFDWTSTVAIDKVIVKGGPNANVYTYNPASTGDDGLHAPINASNGEPYGLSHLEFCTDPKPRIEVEKSGPTDAYVGDEVTFTFKARNTGNVALTDVTVTDDKCAPLVKQGSDASFDPGDEWTYTCTTTITANMGDALLNTVKACGEDGDTKVCDEDDHTTKILKPSIALEKTGAAYAYAGDTVEYQFAATNTGNVTLEDVELTDSKCQDTLTRKAGETDTTFGPGDVWNYTCTAVVPAGATSVENVAEVCGTTAPVDAEPREVCDEDDHEFPVRSIAIALDKEAVEATAVAGTTVNFTIAVQNTGNTSFTGYVFDDPRCDEVRTGANAGDTTLDPGETWTYACAMPTQVGQTVAENTATATGTNADGKSATATDSASIPLTQPPTTNPPTTNPPTTNPPTTNPPAVNPPVSEGDVAPERIVSGRASLRGPSGCVRQAFTARVRGRAIASVTFFVDGKRVKRDTKAAFTLKVNPKRYGLGRHRVEALVRFKKSSGTSARRLPLTFRRCAQQPVAPRFTG